jgi:hypothetical protein
MKILVRNKEIQSGLLKMSLSLHLYGTPLVAFISKADRKLQAQKAPKTAWTIVAKYDTFSVPDCIKRCKKILPALMLLLLESNFFF